MTSRSNPDSLSNWITHVFEHPVTEPAWHCSIEAPIWSGTDTNVATYIAEAFERSGELLGRFTDAQLEQGFWYLTSLPCSEFMLVLAEPTVPIELRLRALRSFVPLFEQVMAVRCSQHLSHLDEQPANPLNGACYMWWDNLPVYGMPEELERKEFDAEVLRVLAVLLRIPHDACRESALHGVGEWHCYYPDVKAIVDEFLAHTPGLRPELVTYARNAQHGNVQ